MLTQLLIADSDTTTLDRCRPYFSNRGYQVEVAANGLRCLQALRRLPPDILVVERELLWGGGDGILAWLRESSPRWPGVVVLTSGEFDALPFELAPPVKALLPRPYSMLTLFERIQQARDGETTIAARFLRSARSIHFIDLQRAAARFA